MEQGALTDYALWRPDAPDGVGDQFTGRVTARAAALGGVFIDFCAGSGFLPDSAGGKTAREGDLLVVQVSRAPQGGKGPRLMVVAGTPAAKPGLMMRGVGPIADFLALQPDAAILVDDFELLARLRPLHGAITYRSGCFDAAEDEVASLAEPVFALPGGARATVSPTPALTAIDIDAGSTTAERGTKPVAQARLNRAILPELARQIRLRNLGGAILIDFAGMKVSARAALGPDLSLALARDPARPRLLGFTSLGFAEIVRPRRRAPLHEVLAWQP